MKSSLLVRLLASAGIVLVAILPIPLIAGPAAPAQAPPVNLRRTLFVPANDVSFVLSVEGSALRIRDKVTVTYRIENVSNRSLYVPLGFAVTACLYLGPPHVWGWFENSAGEHFEQGYGASCASGLGDPPTLKERMARGTVLLRPGEGLDGTLQLDPRGFSLPAGPYQIEAVLRGWTGGEFTETELEELATMGNPFLRGEIPASIRVVLEP